MPPAVLVSASATLTRTWVPTGEICDWGRGTTVDGQRWANDDGLLGLIYHRGFFDGWRHDAWKTGRGGTCPGWIGVSFESIAHLLVLGGHLERGGGADRDGAARLARATAGDGGGGLEHGGH